MQRWIWRGLVFGTFAAAAWITAGLDWAAVRPSWPFLLQALGRSWLLALIAIAAGAVAAIPLAMLRVYGPPWPRRSAVFVIEAIRMTPELMIVFWIYFAAPVITRSSVTAWSAAVWALSLIAASHLAEVIRAGLLSVPGGQREAAAALGLKRRHGFALVVLPQALRNMVPALIAQVVALFKTTSLAYAIGVMEFFRAVTVTDNAIYEPYPLYLVLAAGYFASCWAITRLVRFFDPSYHLVE